VVVDPDVLLEEMKQLTAAGVDISRLLISDRAHVIMPYHKLWTAWEEDARPRRARAISVPPARVGPAYEDKTARIGIRMGDLVHEAMLLTKLSSVLPAKNAILEKIYNASHWSCTGYT